jgi:hypothetical protein
MSRMLEGDGSNRCDQRNGLALLICCCAADATCTPTHSAAAMTVQQQQQQQDACDEQQQRAPASLVVDRPRRLHTACPATRSSPSSQRPRTAGAAGSTRPPPARAQQRPASAAPGGNSRRHATLARLKAELSALAAGSNIQLQSLRPATAAAHVLDACADLHDQVCVDETLEQLCSFVPRSQASTARVLQALDQLVQCAARQDPSLTYSQARAAAAAAVAAGGNTPPVGSVQSMVSCSAVPSGLALQAKSTTASSAAAAAAADGTPSSPTVVAAAAALAEMRQWATEQEVGMLEVCWLSGRVRSVSRAFSLLLAAAQPLTERLVLMSPLPPDPQPEELTRYPSRAVAARVSTLRTEALVLQCQRQF